MPTALTIAGSDSSGGAGIQADLKTFEAHGVYGMTAITAITAQNTTGVTDIQLVSPAMVAAQVMAVTSDIGADATKIGMLGSAAIAEAVAALLSRQALRNVVLDTVMVAKSGARLLDADAIRVLQQQLLPLATVVTPNIPEAEALLGRAIRSVDDLEQAARDLVGSGARAVIVKGGHLPGAPIDVLYDGDRLVTLDAERVESRHTHGTGCTFSAAIAARLALGDDLVAAARAAKRYVTAAIRRAPGLGRGHGPLGHSRTLY